MRRLGALIVFWGSLSQASYSGLGVETLTAAQIQKFAAPALETELRRSIELMFDIRSPGSGILNPKNKKELYFGWSVTGTAQVWKISGPQGFPVQMTAGEDRTWISGITPDGEWLLLSRDRQGEENPGLYMQKTSGGQLQLIQHLPKVRTILQYISEDGQWIYFSANDRVDSTMSLYRYDLKSGEKTLIFDQPGVWSIADVREGKTLLLNKVKGNFSDEVFEFDLATKNLTPILGQDENEEYNTLYGPKLGQLIVKTSKFDEFGRIYIYENKKFEPLTKEHQKELSGFAVDRKKRRLLYLVNNNGFTELHGLDLRRKTPLKLPKFSGADHVTFGSWTRDGRTVMIQVETSKAPRSSYSYDFESGRLQQWVLASAPEVDTSQFVAAENVLYPARDGEKIPMLVRIPPECRSAPQSASREKPCPVVIHYHGGPESQSLPGFDVFAQMFTMRGMIYAEPNVRGSTGFGKAFRDRDNGPKRLEVLSDIEDAALYFKKNYAVKGVAPKVGAIGWSYGGYSTLIAMTKYSESFDAGVALVGMSDLRTFLMNTAPYRRALRAIEYGDPEKDKEALKALSPMTYLSELKKPLMIIQGANDPRVPVGEAIQIFEAAQKKKLKSELIIFPDEGHGSSKRSNRVLERGHTLRFMIENLTN
jgi:dipeptidyl aminopeptidase/acylaminoacyl peptidase